MVERFNGRIGELLQQNRFDSRADLETTLLNYLKLYNHHVPQRAIGSKTPIQALKEWQQNERHQGRSALVMLESPLKCVEKTLVVAKVKILLRKSCIIKDIMVPVAAAPPEAVSRIARHIVFTKATFQHTSAMFECLA